MRGGNSGPNPQSANSVKSRLKVGPGWSASRQSVVATDAKVIGRRRRDLLEITVQ